MPNVRGTRHSPPKRARRRGLDEIVKGVATDAEQIASERCYLLLYFWQRVNTERDGIKYKKMLIGAVAAKLRGLERGLELRDLCYLQSICEDARRRGEPWARCFWAH